MENLSDLGDRLLKHRFGPSKVLIGRSAESAALSQSFLGETIIITSTNHEISLKPRTQTNSGGAVGLQIGRSAKRKEPGARLLGAPNISHVFLSTFETVETVSGAEE